MEATAEGKSIFAYDKGGKVAAAYEQFGKEVAELVLGDVRAGHYHRHKDAVNPQRGIDLPSDFRHGAKQQPIRKAVSARPLRRSIWA